MAVYNGTAGNDSSINDSTQSLGLRLLNGNPVQASRILGAMTRSLDWGARIRSKGMVRLNYLF